MGWDGYDETRCDRLIGRWSLYVDMTSCSCSYSCAQALANTSASRDEHAAMTVAMDNLRTRIVALQQQPLVRTCAAYHTASLDTRIPKVLQAVERRKRVAALEQRSPAMRPVQAPQ